MKGQSLLIRSASEGVHAADTPGPASGTTGAPRYLTTATLAARWRVAPDTIREWARAGRITDAAFVGGEWVFLDTSRLRILAPKGTVAVDERLVDLADYPQTVADIAATLGRVHGTIRRWARLGLLVPAVQTPVGWRFGAVVADPSKPQPTAASGQPAALGAPDAPEADDPLAELRALSFEVRWSGPRRAAVRRSRVPPRPTPNTGRTSAGLAPFTGADDHHLHVKTGGPGWPPVLAFDVTPLGRSSPRTVACARAAGSPDPPA